MEAKDLREKSADELKLELKKSRDALMKSRFSKSSGQLKNLAEIRSKRRDIARTLTILKEKGAKNG